MQLHAAVDIYDEILKNEAFYDEAQILELMRGLRALGVERLEWVVDTMWGLYDGYPRGFDLLPAAVAAAHEAGLEIDAVYKPFEATLAHLSLPLSAPRPAHGRYLVDPMRGIIPVVRSFEAAHPEYALAREPEPAVSTTAIAAIRLLKGDAEPVDLAALRITLYTSAENGRWTLYEGPLSVTQSAAWREWMYHPQPAGILTLAGLELPPDHAYIRIEVDGLSTSFVAYQADMVELVDADGHVVPHTLGNPTGTRLMRQLAQPVMPRICPYAGDPEVQAWLADPALEERAGDYVRYGDAVCNDPPYDLAEHGSLVLARGRREKLLGMSHPAYPEVRANWLADVQMCIDAGVDGVDFRETSHLWIQGGYRYGYNAPVLPSPGERLDHAAIQDANSAAYTQFLREAAACLHDQGRRIGVHVIGSNVLPADQRRAGELSDMFARDWPLWIDEIADYVVMRGAMGMRPGTIQRVVDRLAQHCRQASKPLIYQSNRRDVSMVGPYPLLQREMEWVTDHPGVAAYQLYETANFTRLDDGGRVSFSDDFMGMVRQYAWT